MAEEGEEEEEEMAEGRSDTVALFNHPTELSNDIYSFDKKITDVGATMESTSDEMRVKVPR